MAEVRGLLDAGEFGAALAAAEDALAAPDAAPVLHRLRAEASTGLLDYASAIESLERAPADSGASALRVRLLALLGRDREAEEAAQALAASGAPIPPRSRAVLSEALRGAGLPAAAVAMLGPPEVGEPPALTLERARLRIAADDCAGAVAPLRRAASSSPPAEGAAHELGRCLALLDREEEAERWLRRAVAESPGDRAARFRLGQLLAQDEDARRSAEGRRLLRGYEEHRLRERRRQLLLSMVTGGELAGLELRDALVQLLGLLLDGMETGGGVPDEEAEALSVLAAGSLRFPDDPAFPIARARWLLLTALDGPRRAEDLLAPLVPEAPRTLSGPALSAARWLAEARLRRGDPPAAAALFDRVLAAAREPISFRLLNAAATAFALAGDPERALRLFDRLADSVSGAARAEPLVDGAFALEMLARDREAETRYREALAVAPGHTGAAAGLAELLVRVGRRSEAAAVLREALAHSGESDALEALLARIR